MLPTILTGIASKIYWGYWIFTPSIDELLDQVVKIEQYTFFQRPSREPFSGEDALLNFSSSNNETLGDWPLGRLPNNLVIRNLHPSNQSNISINTLNKIEKTLLQTGTIPAHAFPLWGSIAYGKNKSNKPIYIIALSSQQISNDRYIYYEGVLIENKDNELIPLPFISYFYEIAGLEGIYHWLVAELIITIQLFLLALLFIFKLAIRKIKSIK